MENITDEELEDYLANADEESGRIGAMYAKLLRKRAERRIASFDKKEALRKKKEKKNKGEKVVIGKLN